MPDVAPAGAKSSRHAMGCMRCHLIKHVGGLSDAALPAAAPWPRQAKCTPAPAPTAVRSWLEEESCSFMTNEGEWRAVVHGEGNDQGEKNAGRKRQVTNDEAYTVGMGKRARHENHRRDTTLPPSRAPAGSIGTLLPSVTE
ncbi:hypothetical protein MYCTH_2121946 [Thermothelomyces thermophilus ATCC 42464]|uniref:Uncharacterized protein n=1 Tax=Thermothelomyces thermophilus (strain ATCC 42464 / BCRC 31852 / DSM 1799) TaxID=573729 RepID=G2PZP1_THET4|nr:uncharacterized protein MYCTH_2121946 [Thermothelomyces thermophilus ATCC 42464]AEO53116.1 hypothetical protein MYCTH_2121946 [Thermothelomyces thermophilus ATCC 42464]